MIHFRLNVVSRQKKIIFGNKREENGNNRAMAGGGGERVVRPLLKTYYIDDIVHWRTNRISSVLAARQQPYYAPAVGS